MGHIFAFMTGTHTVHNGPDSDDYTEEHGWIDLSWSRTVLYDSRNDVRPLLSMWEDDETLAEEIQDVIIGFESNGDGTFYSVQDDQPNPDESWSYAIHFKRKYQDSTGWTEENYVPEVNSGS